MTDMLDARPAADASLSDGTTTLLFHLLERKGSAGIQQSSSPSTSLKISSGQGGYDDLELPFSVTVQDDWSGGRAGKVFEKDKTRYRDAQDVDTTRANEMRLGPLATWCSDLETTKTWEGTTAGTGTLGSDWVYCKVVPEAMTVGSVSFRLKVGALDATAGAAQKFSIRLTAHDSGNDRPDTGSILATGTFIQVEADDDYTWHTAALSAYTTAGGTAYWIGISVANDLTDTSYEYIAASSAYKIMTYSGGAWSTVHADAIFQVRFTDTGSGKRIFFDYRGSKLCVTNSDAQAVPKVWIEGIHLNATSNSTDKKYLNFAWKSTALPSLVGKYVQIIAGPGAEETQNWRKIVAQSETVVGAKDYTYALEVSPPWNTAHTTSTEFAITGVASGSAGWWQLSDSADTPLHVDAMDTYLTKPVTSVLVVDDIIYFAMGEATRMARTRFTGGAWAAMAQEEAASTYTYLALVQDDEGVKRVWAAKAAASTIVEATKVAFASTLTFDGNPLVCGDASSRITNLIAAKISGPELPVVFKETEFGAVAGTGAAKVYDTYRKFPEARDTYNGRAAIQKDLYLWFAMGEGIERYYDQRLDDIGPNRDEGLPKGRRGRVSSMLEYYSRLYAAVDAGDYGYSSILCFNGVGWHEVYRGGYGERIQGMSVQALPDMDTPDRLYFTANQHVHYLPLALNPLRQNGYEYASSGTIESGRIYANFKDITKYWGKIAIFNEDTAASAQTIGVEVRADGGAWVSLGTVDSPPVEEIDILNGSNYVTGRYLEYRLTLATTDETTSPTVEAVRLDGVIRVPVKRVTQITAVLTDGYTVDRNGTRNYLSVASQYNQLLTWESSTLTPAPLTFGFIHSVMDNIVGFIQGVNLAATSVRVEPDDGRTMSAIVGFSFMETL